MVTLNRLQRIYTHEGAPAKRIDALAQLERSVMSCLLWFFHDFSSFPLISLYILPHFYISVADMV